MSEVPAPNAAAAYIAAMDSVPGWFYPADAHIFIAIDSLQKSKNTHGDLMEIGAYLGKSAILLGYLTARGEHLVVCDLFAETVDISAENAAENRKQYPRLQRDAFEDNYLRFHPTLPEILAMPSTQIDPGPLEGSFRLVHIDGSHTYEVVRHDIAIAQRILGSGGVVVFDDWMQPHAPGVALAFWEEFLHGRLLPLCFTHLKFYATWDPAGISALDLDRWAAAQPYLQVTDPVGLAGHEVRRYTMERSDVPSAGTPSTAASPLRRASAPRRASRGLSRTIARRILPPAALSFARRIRRGVARGQGRTP